MVLFKKDFRALAKNLRLKIKNTLKRYDELNPKFYQKKNEKYIAKIKKKLVKILKIHKHKC